MPTDSVRVGILDVLSAYHPSFQASQSTLLFGLFSFFSFFNLLCASILVTYTDGADFLSTKSNKSFHEIFYESSIDCFIISIAETILFPVIAYLAIQSSKQRLGTEEATSCDCYRCAHRCRLNISSFVTGGSGYQPVDRDNKDDERIRAEKVRQEPLLSTSADEETVGRDDYIFHEGYEDEDRRLGKIRSSDGNAPERSKDVDEEYLRLRKKMNETKNLWTTFIFVLSTVVQVYLGLKCISFSFEDEAKEGPLMGLGVLWANLLSWTMRELVEKGSTEEGEYLPSLHPHRLHLHASLGSHWCDLCGQQCREGRAFRCKLCDFDLCTVCHAKRDKFSLEGQLRGDRGIRTEDSMTGEKYFLRALALARQEWKIFSLALLALCLYNCINLAMPRVQGSILNSVVDGDRDSFDRWVKFYLILSVAAGLLSGLQSLAFNVVGRKLANTIRKRLFQGIIVQDVAYFDGNSSGQLTSRLTNDVSFMVSPIQSMLGTLVSNSILLIGGIVLCFVTSWRLSMLAFTTVGPIIHCTQVYASWSQSLNRKIYGALAAANGYATEALGNIRTVKSFSTEEHEGERYNSANDTALRKGLADAFGGAGMYTINSYLELGAAVLILWYGGIMAMDDRDGMSPGKLITYQLYWNMLNSAYKSLLDIVTSFTRSAGAAQRVFQLMDALPDIDINVGQPLHSSEITGHLELRDLSFAYQMRPDTKVLDGINLVIPAGSTCALVGKSGGGKSTIVNMLMRFYDPKEGCILLDGLKFTDLCLRDVRRSIGLVQQNTELFGGTIEENITYGLPVGSWTRADVIEAATKACAHEFIKGFPEGYMTRVGERGIRISGGQKQRIAIARVFLRKPKILLLDEATSALDTESEAKVQEALDTLMAERDQRRTVILVAHRLSTVINADQIAVVKNGRIAELGSHEVLYSLKGEYFNLVQRQLKKKNNVIMEGDDVDND